MAVTGPAAEPPVHGELLVLRALGLGDLLTAVPALRGLRQAFPELRLVLAAPGGLADLVPLTGAVDELLPTPGLGALSWRRDAPRLAVNLHGSGPESIAELLTARPGRLISHRHTDFPDVDGPQWPHTHEVRRWCALLDWHGIPNDPDDLTIQRPVLPSPAPGAVVVHPGAGAPARCWPPHRYATVARKLTMDGHRVVITGSAAELPLAQRVATAAGLPDSAVLAGRTRLTELAALVAGATLVVSGDTGVAHLATAYGTPSVLLFGPISPRHWGPPPGRALHRALWAGRTGDPHGSTPDAGLLRLSVPDVLTAASAVLSSHRSVTWSA